MLGKVALLKITAFDDVQLAHLSIGILHGFALYRDNAIAVFVGERAIPFRADQAHKRSFFADGFNIVVLEMNALSGALAACLHAGLALPDHDDVVADSEEG